MTSILVRSCLCCTPNFKFLPKALSDYKHQYYFPAEKEGYAGVALISKVEPLKVDNGFGIDEAKEHDAGK